jgi:hypothetical protein
MKTKLNMKTTLFMILFAAGCAQAQECADSDKNLTVTDINGRVLMTNASYTCMYQGRLFFGRGCHNQGFAAASINPIILARLGLDLKDVEAKGREDVKKKQAFDRAYQRYAQIEDERIARRAEAEAARRAANEKAAREAAREEMLALSAMNEAARAAAVQWGEPSQAGGASVTVVYPEFDQRRHHPPRPQWYDLKSVGEKGASQSAVFHPGTVAAPNIRPKLPAHAPRTSLKGNAGGNRKAFSRPAPSIRR